MHVLYFIVLYCTCNEGKAMLHYGLDIYWMGWNIMLKFRRRGDGLLLRGEKRRGE